MVLPAATATASAALPSSASTLQRALSRLQSRALGTSPSQRQLAAADAAMPAPAPAAATASRSSSATSAPDSAVGGSSESASSLTGPEESERRLKLNLEFTLGPGYTVTIPVYEGDTARGVARKFVQAYGLIEAPTIEPLITHLVGKRLAEM